MNYTVYIIFSEHVNQFYIGHTEDVKSRLEQHQSGRSKSTKKATDWALKYTEEFGTRGEAMLREKAIKAKKSRKYIEFLVNG